MYDPTKPFTNEILTEIKRTWDTSYVTVKEDGIIEFKKIHQLYYDHTDGTGSKFILCYKYKKFKEIVQDVMAMNLNDLLIMRAIPFKLQNHLILPEEKHINLIIKELVESCLSRNIAITGGETSIQNGMDLSLTVSSFIPEYKPNVFVPGNKLIGLRSSGIHANGLTKARELLGDDKELTVPTRIYYDDVFPLLDRINGLAHITGGGFTKIKKFLKNEDVIIKQHSTLPIFHKLFSKIVFSKEMYEFFNCGIGMVLSAETEIPLPYAEVIGEVVSGTGNVYIKSKFDKGLLKL